MLKYGNCLIFRKCEDLRNMMKDMERYQGQKIRRDWIDLCETTINEQGFVYVIVQVRSFVHSRYKPCDVRRFIEVNPRKSNKRW